MKKRMKGQTIIFACGLLMLTWSLDTPAFGTGDFTRSARSAADYFSDSADEDDGEDTSGYGPGVTAAVVEESLEAAGPKVHDITMSERYHEEFGLYEESLNNQYFLYSNVANGGITDKPVYVDIPADLLFTMEKDGNPIPYISKQRVADKGTYVLRITAVYDKNVPLAEQEEYRTVFRFRIDDKIPETAAEGGGAGNGLAAASDFLNQRDTAESSAGEIVTPEETIVQGEETEAEESGILSEESGEAGIGAAGESEAGDQKETDESEDRDNADEAVEASANDTKALKTQTYDKTKNMYQIVFLNGFTFQSNVPENMITSSRVRLILEEDSEYQLYRGEEELEWDVNQELTEFGQYRLVSGDEEFRFEISNTYINWDEYQAPVGTEITEVTFKEEKLSLTDRHSFVMKEDGKYTIALMGDGGERYTVTLNRDTDAPKFTVQVERQRAAITYLADDMASITLKKNGEEPKAFISTAVTVPGKYVLTVTDRAGNSSSEEFTLRYHLNMYAVTAILIIAAGIAGGVVFLLRKKRNLGVR